MMLTIGKLQALGKSGPTQPDEGTHITAPILSASAGVMIDRAHAVRAPSMHYIYITLQVTVPPELKLTVLNSLYVTKDPDRPWSEQAVLTLPPAKRTARK